MREVSVFDAKTHFSGLIEKIYKHHESIIITRRGMKIAKIIPFESDQMQNVVSVLQELDTLSAEVGKVGIRLNDIAKMKKEGRK